MTGGLIMDELKNCKLCGKLYQSNAITNACPSCIEHDIKDFETIREYLYQHPHASIYEVATNLEFTINKIKHYLRDGRIEVIEKDNHFLACETCGKPIHSGWYCDDCLKQPSRDSKVSHSGSFGGGDASSNANNPPKKDSKMNFLSKDKK